MKKLFFFRSSSSSGNNNEVPLQSTDKQVYWENPLESGLSNKAGDKGLFSKSRKQVSESQSSSISQGLRRSRSLSSAAFFGGDLEQVDFACSSVHSRSPSSGTAGGRCLKNGKALGCRALAAERQQKANQSEIASIQNANALDRTSSADSPGNSSSSNGSGKIVDRYIDGEQQEQEGNRTKVFSYQRNPASRKGSRRHLPQTQNMGTSSQTDDVEVKPRSHSFREAENTHVHVASRGLVSNGFGGHESPRRLAKNVIEKLSQSRPLPKSKPRDYGCDVPITIEDVYGRSLNRCFDSIPEIGGTRVSEHHRGHSYSGLEKESSFLEDTGQSFNYKESYSDLDIDLQRRLEQAEERILCLSEELEQEKFLRDGGFNASALMQRIRGLTEEKMSLALEVSGLIQSQITERSSAKEELELAKTELELRTHRLEREKNEMQSALEKELDRRSSDWSSKLEKYQQEELRLRERVRELAEQNVSLQREVSTFHERESETQSMVAYSEQQLKDLTIRIEELSQENLTLRQSLSELHEKHEAVEEECDCIKRNFEEKSTECKDLHKSVSRLLRTCSEQEKSIDGLRGNFSEEIGKKQSQEKLDTYVTKLQTEQIRLTGIEMALRRELESYRIEVDSLRHENINLLNRLKSSGKGNDAVNFKLDKEIWARICCLQNQGLSMLNESTQKCSKLLELVKEKTHQLSDVNKGSELIENGLDVQFIIESEMKIQGLKRGTESLSRSLQTMSALLDEKLNPILLKFKSQSEDADDTRQQNDKTPQDTIRSELKAECLLTSLLREKLYSKELEVEQIQAELATAVRGNDILKCEVQNAMDNLSCATHKLRDLELQMLKKDESISQLQNDLQETVKELTIMRRTLPKVMEERDSLWDKVKRYSESNMLLNSELNMLKKKVEALDEDIHIKEGQITILKDTLGNKPFDLLASPDSTREFLLQ